MGLLIQFLLPFPLPHAALHTVYPSALVRQGYNPLPKNHSSIKVLIITLWDIELTEHDIDGKTIGPQYT